MFISKLILFRERIINVIVTKEKIDNEERERKEAEELKKKREQAWREKVVQVFFSFNTHIYLHICSDCGR